jgi:hypothetical protein
MASPSRVSRPTSPFSGESRDTPEQSPKIESPSTQQVPPTQVPSPSVVLSNDEQETDLQSVISKPFPHFNANYIHQGYNDVAAEQTRFEEGAIGSFLLVPTRIEPRLVTAEIEGTHVYVY